MRMFLDYSDSVLGLKNKYKKLRMEESALKLKIQNLENNYDNFPIKNEEELNQFREKINLLF